MSDNTTEYKGYTITIDTDMDPMDPRTEWDNFGDMIAVHRDYTLGDHGHKREDRWDADKASAYIVDLATADGMKLPADDDGTDPGQYREKALEYLNKKGVVLPLYLLDHSGITISTGRFASDAQGWDTSYVGWIIATPTMIKKEYGRNTKATRAKAEKLMRAEVKTYAAYLEGDVCAWRVEKDGEFIDGVSGYYGYFENKDDMLSEARAAADAHAKKTIEKHVQKKKAEIKNRVPLNKRTALDV